MHAEDGAGPADVLPFQTSRLCVKNIPKYVNEARLRRFFSEQGDVTDVKIVKTKCALLGPCALLQFSAPQQRFRSMLHPEGLWAAARRTEAYPCALARSVRNTHCVSARTPVAT